MLQSAKGLALKSFIVLRCTEHRVEAKGSSKSQLAEFEDKVKSLERQSKNLKEALAAERAQHTTSRAEAEALVALSKRLDDELKGSNAKVDELTSQLIGTIEGRERVRDKYRALKKAVKDGTDKIFEEMPIFMSYYGLTIQQLTQKDLDTF